MTWFLINYLSTDTNLPFFSLIARGVLHGRVIEPVCVAAEDGLYFPRSPCRSFAEAAMTPTAVVGRVLNVAGRGIFWPQQYTKSASEYTRIFSLLNYCSS
jgi:hypothetical protein